MDKSHSPVSIGSKRSAKPNTRSAAKRAKLENIIAVKKSPNPATTIYNLPDHLFLDIIQYLSFEERVRVGRVSGVFRRISQLCISRTKTFFLNDVWDLCKLTPDSLRSIFNLCFRNLEKIRFWKDFYILESRFAPLWAILAEFSFPRLIELNIFIDKTTPAMFSTLLKKNPNLRSVQIIGGKYSGRFSNAVFEKLEILVFSECDDKILRVMTGKFPNLKKIQIHRCNCRKVAVVDRFFESIPKLESLNLPIEYQKLSLTEFTVYGNIDDDFLKKMAASLHQLQTLRIIGQSSITAAGFEALGSLKNLRKFYIHDFDFPNDDLDMAIRKLAACNRLENVFIGGRGRLAALVPLIRFCPDLRHVTLRTLADPETMDVVMTGLLELLIGLNHKKITIEIGHHEHEMIYRSAALKTAMEKLEEIGIVISLPVWQCIG